MIKLSKDTKALLEKLIPDIHKRNFISDKLESECGDHIYRCGDGTPESLERLRFSVLKLYIESDDKYDIDHWIELAKFDWRDLFMAADFGFDIDAHEKWKNKILTSD